MRWLYTALYTLGFILLSPLYLYKMWKRGKYRENFFQRFGRYDPALRQRLAVKTAPRYWIQAVSVGEINLALLLARQLDGEVVLTTTTSTGYALARERLPARATLLYFPQDFPPCVRRAFGLIQPDKLILMESEVWPNLVWEADQRGVPVYLVNARLSPRSARRHQWVRWLFRHVFDKLALVAAQSDEDAARFRALGAPRVIMTGNLKYDASLTGGEPLPVEVPADRPVLVAGSTWPGEEEILFDLLRELPELFLVLVPRHVERTPEIVELARRKGVRLALRRNGAPVTNPDCLLVNTTGELKSFYQAATVIFVGKSLTAQGGQNIVEAAASGHPVICGPHMQNFKAIVAEFRAAGACVQVATAGELREAVAGLIRDPARRAAIAEAARRVIAANVGAVERTVRLITGAPASESR